MAALGVGSAHATVTIVDTVTVDGLSVQAGIDVDLKISGDEQTDSSSEQTDGERQGDAGVPADEVVKADAGGASDGDVAPDSNPLREDPLSGVTLVDSDADTRVARLRPGGAQNDVVAQVGWNDLLFAETRIGVVWLTPSSSDDTYTDGFVDLLAPAGLFVPNKIQAATPNQLSPPSGKRPKVQPRKDLPLVRYENPLQFASVAELLDFSVPELAAPCVGKSCPKAFGPGVAQEPLAGLRKTGVEIFEVAQIKPLRQRNDVLESRYISRAQFDTDNVWLDRIYNSIRWLKTTIRKPFTIILLCFGFAFLSLFGRSQARKV